MTVERFELDESKSIINTGTKIIAVSNVDAEKLGKAIVAENTLEVKTPVANIEPSEVVVNEPAVGLQGSQVQTVAPQVEVQQPEAVVNEIPQVAPVPIVEEPVKSEVAAEPNIFDVPKQPHAVEQPVPVNEVPTQTQNNFDTPETFTEKAKEVIEPHIPVNSELLTEKTGREILLAVKENNALLKELISAFRQVATDNKAYKDAIDAITSERPTDEIARTM